MCREERRSVLNRLSLFVLLVCVGLQALISVDEHTFASTFVASEADTAAFDALLFVALGVVEAFVLMFWLMRGLRGLGESIQEGRSEEQIAKVSVGSSLRETHADS